MLKRQSYHSLTTNEDLFLQQVLQNGTEVQVQLFWANEDDDDEKDNDVDVDSSLDDDWEEKFHSLLVLETAAASSLSV